MDELLAALLGPIFEAVFGVIFEAVLELVSVLILELVGRAIAHAIRGLSDYLEEASPVLAFTGFVIVGLAVGGLSLLILPHPVVTPLRIRGISVLISPIVTGLVMSFVGSLLRHYGREAARLESFIGGFAFAFGVTLMRFALVK